MTALSCYVVFCALGLTVLGAIHEEKYAEVTEPINFRAMLRNERIVDLYEKCLMDEGPCPHHGQILKKILPEALKTDCKKCTDKQKQFAEEIIHFLMTEKKKVWQRLCTKYDPDGSLSKKHADKIAALLKQ